MKRLFAILALAFLWSNNINAEMFSVVCESGQTLNYDVTDYIDRVAVVYGGMNLIGDLVISDSVTYNSVTYSVQKIMFEAFKNCGDLTSVTIGNLIHSAFFRLASLSRNVKEYVEQNQNHGLEQPEALE